MLRLACCFLVLTACAAQVPPAPPHNPIRGGSPAAWAENRFSDCLDTPPYSIVALERFEVLYMPQAQLREYCGQPALVYGCASKRNGCTIAVDQDLATTTTLAHEYLHCLQYGLGMPGDHYDPCLWVGFTE